MNCAKCNHKMRVTYRVGNEVTYTCPKCNYYVDTIVPAEKEKSEKKIEIILSYTQEELQDLKEVLIHSINLWQGSNENNFKILEELLSNIEIQEKEESYE